MNYFKKTITELKKICKEREIKSISRKNKKQLIELIEKTETNQNYSLNNSETNIEIQPVIQAVMSEITDKKELLNEPATKHKVKLVIEPELSMEDINARIKQEICYETLEKLTDAKLMCEYTGCNSVKNEIKKLGNVLEKYVNEEIKQKIIQEHLLQLIPAGTKGVIRGNKFNNIVKHSITNLQLDADRFDICFEKKCEGHFTTEIPDWYILEKSTNKIIIGMNQLDLWGGGQQLNRGSKYIENNKHNNDNSKLLCVICNEIQFKSKKNKAYKLFEIGFENNTLCYLKNLQNIITSYFN
jgi:hypothetical protein